MFEAFDKHHELNYFGLDYQRVLFMAKKFNAHTIPLVRYPISPLGSITYLLKFGRVLHNHTKTYKETNSLIKVFYN
jgi:hypothetical protein